MEEVVPIEPVRRIIDGDQEAKRQISGNKIHCACRV